MLPTTRQQIKMNYFMMSVFFRKEWMISRRLSPTFKNLLQQLNDVVIAGQLTASDASKHVPISQPLTSFFTSLY